MKNIKGKMKSILFAAIFLPIKQPESKKILLPPECCSLGQDTKKACNVSI